jgi:hypothetical protein
MGIYGYFFIVISQISLPITPILCALVDIVTNNAPGQLHGYLWVFFKMFLCLYYFIKNCRVVKVGIFQKCITPLLVLSLTTPQATHGYLWVFFKMFLCPYSLLFYAVVGVVTDNSPGATTWVFMGIFQSVFSFNKSIHQK